MSVILFENLPEFTAGDGSRLREFLHPDKQDMALRYSFAHATVTVGQITRHHCLQSSEVYYILSGRGRMTIDNQSYDVKPNCLIYIPPRAVQYIENTGQEDLTFICIVDPAWRKEDEQIL
jgi:mannose-6-phosphate isomerase-like protein (cupin superfamily)